MNSNKKINQWIKNNAQSLINKTVVLTGGTGTIGREILNLLISLNASVILLSRNTLKAQDIIDNLPQKINNSVDIVYADFLSIDSMISAINYITKTYNKIDFLINNAGILSKNYDFNPTCIKNNNTVSADNIYNTKESNKIQNEKETNKQIESNNADSILNAIESNKIQNEKETNKQIESNESNKKTEIKSISTATKAIKSNFPYDWMNRMEQVEFIDKHFLVNCFMPYFLTCKLLPYIKNANGKVITVSSISYYFYKPCFDKVTRHEKSAIRSYAKSKLMLTLAMNSFLQENTGVEFCLTHPGICGTELFSSAKGSMSKAFNNLIMPLMRLVFISPKKASLTTLLAVNSSIPPKFWSSPRGLFYIWGMPKIVKMKGKNLSKENVIFVKTMLDTLVCQVENSLKSNQLIK